METKIIEVRDKGTFIPMLCINFNNAANEAQRYYLRRCGYPLGGRANIGITHLDADGDKFSNDPYFWGGRTRPVAHNYIMENWDNLHDGDVVDVEFILGETKEPKVSERHTEPLTRWPA